MILTIQQNKNFVESSGGFLLVKQARIEKPAKPSLLLQAVYPRLVGFTRRISYRRTKYPAKRILTNID